MVKKPLVFGSLFYSSRLLVNQNSSLSGPANTVLNTVWNHPRLHYSASHPTCVHFTVSVSTFHTHTLAPEKDCSLLPTIKAPLNLGHTQGGELGSSLSGKAQLVTRGNGKMNMTIVQKLSKEHLFMHVHPVYN